MQSIQKPLLTIDEVAEQLKINVHDVNELIAGQAFRAFGVKKKFVRVIDLLGFVNPERQICKLSDREDLTFEEYALTVLNEGIGKGTTRTRETYRRGLAMIMSDLGTVRMREISVSKLRDTFEKLRYDYAQSNINRSFNIARLIIMKAYEDGVICNDLAHKMICPTSQKPRRQNPFPIYTQEDIKILFTYSRKYNYELYAMFVLLECTGIRPGEMRAMTWNAFDPNAKTIYIYQAVTTEYENLETLRKASRAREVLSVTKSIYGVRTMHLSDLAVNTLVCWRRMLSRSANLAKKESPFIFSDRYGKFKSESSCQSILQRFRKKYGLEKMQVTFYKFRHTLCTRLILANQPIPVIQRLMGDNTTDVIMKIYTHVNEEMALLAAQGFYDDLNEEHAKLFAYETEEFGS